MRNSQAGFLLFLSIGTLVFASCGLGARDSRFGQVDTITQNAFIFISGGRSSCESRPWDTTVAHEYRRYLKSGLTERYETVHEFYVCFEDYDYDSPDIYFETHLKPNLIYRSGVRGVETYVEQALDALETFDSFAVGHSYGGWLSLRITEALFGESAGHRLATIDPISAVDCGPAEVILGSSKCRRAPVEFDNAKIAGKTSTWLNFFQSVSNRIHASPMSHASNYRAYREHTEIDTDPGVWHLVAEQWLGSELVAR